MPRNDWITIPVAAVVITAGRKSVDQPAATPIEAAAPQHPTVDVTNEGVLTIIWFVALLFAACASAQDIDSLTRAYPPSQCSSCAEWNEPQDPFKIHGNSYYVGTYGLSAILVTSPEGHVLIDAALPNSAPLILQNIRTLGFDPADIELILNSHVHFDHAGGIAAIQKISNARVAASPGSAPVLEQGRSGPSDPQYGELLDFPAVDNVERFTPGDTLRVGPIALASHATAGHTPGGTSWSWRSCESDDCLNIVYADSQTPISAEGFRYTDSATYPAALADFEHGLTVLENLECDIMFTTHPSFTSVWDKLKKGESLIEPEACRKYAARAREMVANRVSRETGDE